MHVIWGDVIRLRSGLLDLPGNGLPGTLGAIRTINTGPFVNGKAEIVGGDTFYAVLEFQKNGPPIGEALLGYGNWSRAGLEARRRSAGAGLTEEDAADHAQPRGDREEPGKPHNVLEM